MSQKYEIQEMQTYQQKSSNHSTKVPQGSMDSQANNNQVLDEIFADTDLLRKPYRKYGKLKVIFQNERFLFTLGPDYICFVIAYILFTTMHFVVIYTAANTINNAYINIANVLVSLTQNLSYLIVAFSNPGIQTQNTIPTDEDTNSDQIKRFCKKCNIRMQKGTHHCRDCDVCIRKYDHHCPWTSKCIGQKNLTKFYFFVTSTIVYLLYCLVMLLICTAINQIQNDHNKKAK